MTSKCEECEYGNVCFKPLKMAQYLVVGTCKQGRKRREYTQTKVKDAVQNL